MRLAAARQSALLSLLFLAVYGGCNWLASRQTDVPGWYFDWERHIAFWPTMIVPYLSIDLFFVAAPFLCRSRAELRVFSARVTLAILIAGLWFLCFPLRFAFDRPVSDGWSGALLSAFLSLDRPFNLFPSLHVALGLLLAEIYWRHTRGILRGLCAGWFVLIGLSTLFTWQHHTADVAGGLALGTLMLRVLREMPAAYGPARNLRVAAYYAMGTLATGALAAALRPWGLLLLWPATSLLVVTLAYVHLGAGVLGKSNGRLPLSARVLLWPYLLGQWVSLRCYRRHCRAFDEVAPGVWMGRRLDEHEAAEAVRGGVAAVLDLSAELAEPRALTRLAYRNIPVLDLTAPSPDQLDEAVRFIDAHAGSGVVYVHCKIGYSRSAAVIGSWLLSTKRAATAEEALRTIRRARPTVVVRPEAMAALRRFEAALTYPDVRRPGHAPLAPAVISIFLVAAARLLCGLSVRWAGCKPHARPRIYYANHTSHADFIAVWAALPADLRARTRPVAGRDYWNRNALRRYLARRVFRAVLVERADSRGNVSRDDAIAAARRSVTRGARALRSGASLIIFPEGTRGDGDGVRPFKSGLYHLCRLCPDVELVPVRLENMHRVLPKGEALPVPVAASVTFGRPLRFAPGEDKEAFLTRARRALSTENRPWMSSPIPISRAS